MRRIGILALLAALLLAGCSEPAAQSHPEWDESWFRLGEDIGIEPLEGFSLNESNDTLSLSGLYYATWTCGDGRDYVNADGEDATVYDAQIYVLLQECGDGETAAQEVKEWIAHEEQSYTCGETSTEVFGTQEFKILPLLFGTEGNPYGSGVAAFAVRENLAISVELVCSDQFTDDPQPVLTQFLAGFHYSETE